tara:strand:- start:94 stop:1728 length:1635 start_codon:yes stop_codon:yes gene_type:complete
MADKELVAQTGLLTQIAESVRKTNEMTQQNIIADDTSQSIDELKDSISKDNQDQKNLNQETNRQTFVERLKDRLGQSKLFGGLKDSIGTLGTKLGSAFTRFTAPLKDFLGSTVGKIAGFGLGTIASLAAALAFVNSDMFEKMIDFLAKKLPGIIEKFIGFFGQVRDAFAETNENLQSFLANPDLETFKGLFSDVGPIVKALGILLLILSPLTVLRLGKGALFLSFAALGGLFKKDGIIMRGINRLFGKADITKDVDNLTKKDGAFSKFKDLFGKNGKLATNIAKIGAKITGAATALGAALGLTDDAATKSKVAAGIEKKSPGFMSKAFQSARLAKGAGLVGIVLTAGFAVFDTVTAGFEEASRQLDKENPDRAGSMFGRAIEVFKASLAGLINSITFGLLDVSKEDFTLDKSKLPTFLGGDADIFSFNPGAGNVSSFQANTEQMIADVMGGGEGNLVELRRRLNQDNVQNETKFTQLKADLTEAVALLEQRQSLLEELDRGIMNTAAAVNVDASSSSVNNTQHTSRPIIPIDTLTNLALAARQA